MIPYTWLSQNQLWGLEFAASQENKTPEEYLQDVIKASCDSWYESLLRYKEQETLRKFYEMTPEQQAAVLQQIGIEDVLPQ